MAAMMLLAYGLAWQGWCKGEVFIVGSIGLVCGSILVFVGYPVACVLVSAFQDNDGGMDLPLFARKITDSSIWGLGCLAGERSCGVAWNSLVQALVVGVLSTLLGLAFALVATRMRFPFPACCASCRCCRSSRRPSSSGSRSSCSSAAPAW
ncbi:hypothetical protein ACFQU7_25285 [Pseudoroseomonas wenyumeiae]